jgi:hypothetical protein
MTQTRQKQQPPEMGARHEREAFGIDATQSGLPRNYPSAKRTRFLSLARQCGLSCCPGSGTASLPGEPADVVRIGGNECA